MHIYNSTSTLQRDVVFHMEREEITRIAVEGTKMVKRHAAAFPGKIILEYSPESFTGTELDYAFPDTLLPDSYDSACNLTSFRPPLSVS